MQAENGRLDRELRVVREKLGDFEKRAAGDAAFARTLTGQNRPKLAACKALASRRPLSSGSNAAYTIASKTNDSSREPLHPYA